MLNAKCRYHSLMLLQIIVPMPHYWALFYLAQSAKNITDPKKAHLPHPLNPEGLRARCRHKALGLIATGRSSAARCWATS